MKFLVVDDEPPARQRICDLLEELELGTVVAEAANGREALLATESHQPDLIFLDIRMPGMDGLEVARHLANKEAAPAVIFTTAYETHALEAFESNAVDYLLKPIRRERLNAAVERATRPTRAQLSGLQDVDAGSKGRTHVSATISDRLELVSIDEVRYFKAEHKYVTVGYPEGQLLIEDSLNSLEEEFGDRFLRIHRNALVSRIHVRTMERDVNGRNIVLLTDVDEALEVSRRMMVTVKKVLRQI